MNKTINYIKEIFPLSLILILSAVLNFANIGIEGYANKFYAAGVQSMMLNFKNFFFASFDPSGFVTIDKPPLGLWIQTISAEIFGFSGWSIILPQAIAGVISVWVIYCIVKRSFGYLSGLIAALCLAITPIFVASSRNNTIDNILVLFLLLACRVLLIATEKGKFKYLIFSLVLVGLGFNIKMIEAYMVAPALYITYLLSSTISFKNRIKHLAVGTIVLLAVSLSWAVITDLIPASDRPFIGSSTNNSVMDLIIGHNGLQRIGIGGNIRSKQGSIEDISGKTNQIINDLQYQETNGNEMTSSPSILRLFSNNNMSDQIGWLLPFAILGFIVAAKEEKFKFPFDSLRKQSLLMWFIWLLTEFIYFSFSNDINHTYYLTTMAPSIAALVGIGLTTMQKMFKEGGWKTWIIPTVFIINSSIEILILYYNYTISNGYKIVMLITGLLGIIFSIALVLVNRKSQKNDKVSKILMSIAFTGLLIAPLVWSVTPLYHRMYSDSPSAGLEIFSSELANESTESYNSRLISFLEANRKNEKYLVEVPSALTYGSALILKTNEPVLTLGGFNGSDQILTVNQFKQLVTNGSIRYAMYTERASRGLNTANVIGGNFDNIAIMNWIKANGKVVPYSDWADYRDSKSRDFVGVLNDVVLYDLKYKF